MPEPSPFDPRFDPAFQPGFEERMATPPQHPRSVAEPSSLPSDRVREEGPPPLPPDPVAQGEQDQSGHDHPNPFIRVLWIVGVLLVVLGIALYVWVTANDDYSYGGGTVPLRIVVQQTVWAVSPAMVTVGLGTISGLLFWHAARWRPRGR